MLRITQSESSAAARNYFGQSLTRGDYYLEGQEIAGGWGGRGAERLGLCGKVEKEAFERLLENERPDGRALTARKAQNRRPGYDFTFDVPKSVSLMHLFAGDDRILEAMRRAIAETMREMEEEMHARVRKRGAFFDRKTGNMVWADFIHLTSRPAPMSREIEEQLIAEHPWLARHKTASGRLLLPDPHLHAHVFVMNATYDSLEEMWKAGEFMRLKRDATYYQAAYHTRLAAELQKLGYVIEPTATAFEIAGVGRSVVDVFSRRTQEVEAAAKKLGIVNAKAKDALGAMTRSAKVDDLGMDELVRLWRGFVGDQESRQLDRIKRSAERTISAEAIDDPAMAERGIKYALGHELERVSEVSERRLIARALIRTVGHTGVGTVRSALRACSDVVFGTVDQERHVTTQEILNEEAKLMELVRSGRGQRRALIEGKYQFQTDTLKEVNSATMEQRKAVEHLLRSKDWVTGLVGRAGTGKTTLLQEMAAAIRGAKREVIVSAPTAEAARGVLRGEGFAEAETVKQLLLNQDLQAKLKGNVWWIDEAGMIGNRDMLALLTLAKKRGVDRVILSGDARQIRSVSRGDAFSYMEKKSGLSVANLETIRRQKDPTLKEAVEAVSRGEILKAFKVLDAKGVVRELPASKMEAELARMYAEKVSQRGKRGRSKTALVVSPTHAEGERITEAIRGELRTRKILRGDEREVTRTANLAWTKQERGSAASYEPGLVVQFKQNARGFRKSERVRVVDVNARAGEVVVLTNEGVEKPLPLKLAENWEVYAVRTISVAVGETLKITENGYDLSGKARLNNGDVVRVSGFTEKDEIVLSNGRVMPRDFGHLTHGYVITADTAQSKTVDAVYLGIGDESIPATDMRRFYVMLSRAREEAYVFTNDKGDLMAAAQRASVRLTGTDIVGEKRAREIVEHMQREAERAVADRNRQIRERTQETLREIERNREGPDIEI